MSPFEKGHPPYKAKDKEKIEIPEQFKTDSEKKDDKIKELETKIDSTSPQTFVIKTELDAYVNERLTGQPKTLEEVEIKDVSDDSVTMSMLKLPRPIQKALDDKGMVPRWINKDKRMIDRALDVRGWTLFNRVFFPTLPKHFFTANGTVEMGDCILGFMPAKKAELLRKRPGQISQERVSNLPIERFKESKGNEKIGYYKPAYTAEPDGEIATKEAGLFAQPDVATQ